MTSLPCALLNSPCEGILWRVMPCVGTASCTAYCWLEKKEKHMPLGNVTGAFVPRGSLTLPGCATVKLVSSLVAMKIKFVMTSIPTICIIHLAQLLCPGVPLTVAGAQILRSPSPSTPLAWLASSARRQTHHLIPPCDAHSALAAGLAAGMFLSLIWMVLLRFCAGIMAWASVLTVNIFCAACTLLAFLKVLAWPLLALSPYQWPISCQVQPQCGSVSAYLVNIAVACSLDRFWLAV